MKDLVHFIVTSLVSNPEAVQIDEQNDGNNLTYYLTLDPTDIGMIIGRKGQTIRAIRKILAVRAIAENVRVNLQLNESQIATPKESASDQQ